MDENLLFNLIYIEQTPTHRAAERKSEKNLEVLLKSGANVHQVNVSVKEFEESLMWIIFFFIHLSTSSYSVSIFTFLIQFRTRSFGVWRT